MTRTLPLWALFALLLAADGLLARQRGVSTGRAGAAWVLGSVLLWAGAGAFAYLGARLTYVPSEVNGPPWMSGVMRGLAIGAAIGAVLGAPLGIALSQRARGGRWPRPFALGLSAAALALAIAAVLAILFLLEGRPQQAGGPVLVVFPLLGAAAVLGWLLGERR